MTEPYIIQADINENREFCLGPEHQGKVLAVLPWDGRLWVVMGHKPPRKKAQRELLAAIKATDGAEIHEDMEEYKDALALKKQGLVNISTPRGPGKKWHRVTLRI